MRETSETSEIGLVIDGLIKSVANWYKTMICSLSGSRIREMNRSSKIIEIRQGKVEIG